LRDFGMAKAHHRFAAGKWVLSQVFTRMEADFSAFGITRSGGGPHSPIDGAEQKPRKTKPLWVDRITSGEWWE
jgi:hypothetical protein